MHACHHASEWPSLLKARCPHKHPLAHTHTPLQITPAHAPYQAHCQLAFLPSCHPAFLLSCRLAVLLSCCLAALLPCRLAVLLFCCLAFPFSRCALLSCCVIVLLSCCFIASCLLFLVCVISSCFTVVLSCCLAVVVLFSAGKFIFITHSYLHAPSHVHLFAHLRHASMSRPLAPL